MKMSALTATLALVLSMPMLAYAQAKPETLQTCRKLADETARLIESGRSRGVPPGNLVTRRADNWMNGVQNHMLLSAEQARSLSRSELATLGYQYCVERRPAGM